MQQATEETNQFLEFALPPTIPQSAGLASWNMPAVSYQHQVNDDSITEQQERSKQEPSSKKGDLGNYGSIKNTDQKGEEEEGDEYSDDESLIGGSGRESGMPSSIYIKPKNRPFKDVWFTLLYTFCLLTMVIAGILFVASKSTTTPVSKTLFLPLWNAAGMSLEILIFMNGLI